jgi:hypothetical protein
VAFLEEGTEIARAIGDRLTESGALMDLGFGRLLVDDLAAAREAFEASHVLTESWATRFCARTPRASSAYSPMPRSATATRFGCTWRRTSCSPSSVTPAAPATR